MPELLLAILLVAVIYQDFKSRAVYWLWFPLLMGVALWMGIERLGWQMLMTTFLTNLGFILLQLLGVSVYFSIRERKPVNIINKFLGLGDLFFFLILCSLFSPVNLIFYLLGSLMLIALIYSVLTYLSRLKYARIPLAGNLAITYILLLAVAQVADIDLYSDYVLSSWMI